MSQENVETAERAIAAINARDIDGYLACCTETVELLLPMAGAQYFGADGIRRFFTDIEDTGPDFRIEVQRVQAIGDSTAIAFLRVGATGRTSGIVTGAESANVYDFIDGKMSRIRIFLDRDEALEAAGLAEQAMSQENVEVVRRAIEAFNREDFDAALQDAAPDMTLDWSHSRGPNAGIYVGQDSIRRFWMDIWEPFEKTRFVPQEFIPRGKHVVVPIAARTTGRGGIKVEAKTATVVTFRDGRVVRCTMYQDKSEALEAVRLAQDALEDVAEAVDAYEPPLDEAEADLVELVRRQSEAGNRRDLDAVTSSFAPDAVLDGRVAGDHFEGRAAIRSFLEDWFGTYAELEFGLEEVRALGKRVVFAVVTQNGRPVRSAGHLRQREGWVYVWVGGLIERLRTYGDIDEARAAAERLAEERE